jgi:glycosyltransferase involved in cell wall biosynthesis
MNKIAVVMVVRDEEYFVPISVRNACEHADSVFVLDTGSVDGTIAELSKLQIAFPGKLCLEQKHFGGGYSFDDGAVDNCRNELPPASAGAYREMDARNYALEQAEDIFDPDWILRMDADETFHGYLFNAIRTTQKPCVGFSTELPVGYDPVSLNRTPSDLSSWCGLTLHDPHVFAWDRRKTKVRWTHPHGRHVELSGQYISDPSAALLLDYPVHFHWHRCFGPKAIYTFLYWDLLMHHQEHGIPMKIPYGGVDVLKSTPGLPAEIGMHNRYSTEAYKKHMPHLFDEHGRYIVPRRVQGMFKHRMECPTKIDQYVLDAWKSFLVYA